MNGWLVEQIGSEPIHLRILRVAMMLKASGLPVTPDVVAIYFCCDGDFADWGGLDRLLSISEAMDVESRTGLN